MKIITTPLLVALIAFLSVTSFTTKKPTNDICSGDKIDYANCTFKGFKLYGKIKVVDAFPDIKVQIVDAFPDLKVKVVDAFPDQCGKWKFVDAFPDVKVQFVTAFPDIKIKYVDGFPGKP
jgi:hypothetical protein